LVDALTKHVDTLSDPELVEARLKEAGIDGKDRRVRLAIACARELRGFPRHLSQHVGGFVITRGRLDEIVPVENAAMENRTVIEWHKDDIEELGMLKMDCLALGMLSALQRSFHFIEEHHDQRWDLARVLETDYQGSSLSDGVYDMICEGDTVGVFQIESRAQMQMLPRLRPRTFYDLVIEVAIIRPGPIQGGMVHPYLRRRNGEEPVVYPIPAAEAVLKKTLGVPLFQEQAMQLAIVAAGYTPGEADQLRKDMAAWKRTGMLDHHRNRLLSGMAERGIAPEFAEATWQQIRGFSGYGFPESHSASFALIVYVSCFLKRYYPAAFCAALLNSQPMGFYQPSSLVRDAKEHGVEVRGPDVNFSHHECTLEEACAGIASEQAATWGHGGPSLRLGLCQIRGMNELVSAAIVRERGQGPFRSIDDFARRTAIDRGSLNKLAEAGAFASLGLTRREALWQVRAWQPAPPLLAKLESKSAPVKLPAMGLADEVYEDYRTLGLSLQAHPLSLVREALSTEGIITCQAMRQAREGKRVEIAGIVLCRQRPGTASGVVFMTLEDESGVANVIVWAKVFEEFRQTARLSKLLRVRGKVQRDATGKVINLIAESLAPLRLDTRPLVTSSRDFH
ncbi:MAG: error-prone DNA polymerase, partial [Planctomycetes bacterium]|nr:error-prone DNA polymerase [Planctomycetota bacterium]